MAFLEITGKELHRLDAYMARHNGRLPSAYRVQPAPAALRRGTDHLTLSCPGPSQGATGASVPAIDADAPATRLADLARLGRDFDAPIALAVPLRRAVAATMLELGGRQADLNAQLDVLYQTLDAVAEGALILSADDLARRLKAVLSDVADTRLRCTPTQTAALDRLVATIADEARRATTKCVAYKQPPPCTTFETVCAWGVAVSRETVRRVSRAAAALAGWD